MKTVLVIGATGRLGKEVVEELKKVGHNIKILARTPENVPGERNKKFEVIQGDGLNKEDVLNAAKGASIVVSCVGQREAGDSKNRLCTNVTKNVIEANPKKYIVASTATLSQKGDKVPVGQKLFAKGFKSIAKHIQMDREEERSVLEGTKDFNYTILRMPNLKEQASGNVFASDNVLKTTVVYTRPLAHWIVNGLIEGDKFKRKLVFVSSPKALKAKDGEEVSSKFGFQK